MVSADFQKKTFLVLLVVVSIAFGWILLPFYGAVFWAAVFAILFTPLYRLFLAGSRGRRNLAAFLTLLVALLIVILPLTLIGISLAQQAALVYESIRSGTIDFGAYFQQMVKALPSWLVQVMDRLGVGNIASLRDTLSGRVAQDSQAVARQAFSLGQNATDFLISFAIMLYLLFFLLRDGALLAARIQLAIPLSAQHKRNLLEKFTTVIRATVKGNIVVAATQGALGGLIFWILGIEGPLLWGALMALLSLLPAVGAALVWLPVALYFLAIGAFTQGMVLIAYGVLVIGLVDNLLRPLLVGKDTQMPDYLVLVSTIGGMALFGLNGFVIGPVIAALFIAAWDLFASTQEVQHPE